MIVCHVKTIVHNQSFFTDFVLVCSKEIQEKTYTTLVCRIHGKHDGINYNFVHYCIHKLSCFFASNCNWFSLHLMYKLIFLLLMLCRAITRKVLAYKAETLLKHTFCYVDCECASQEYQKRTGFCRSGHIFPCIKAAFTKARGTLP